MTVASAEGESEANRATGDGPTKNILLSPACRALQDGRGARHESGCGARRWAIGGDSPTPGNHAPRVVSLLIVAHASAEAQTPLSTAADDGCSAEPAKADALTAEQQHHLREAEQLTNLRVLELWKAGQSREAPPLAQEALRFVSKSSAWNTRTRYLAFSNLGTSTHALGEYAKAEPLLRRHRRPARTLRANHPDYADILNNLATLYQARGDYLRAEPLFRQAIGDP